MSTDLGKLLPKDITPHAVVADLNHLIADGRVEEIYVVVKTKDGEWAPSCSGNLAGLAFAALYLQKFWNEHP